ncbi:DMT family transporter [Roseivirga misakiensis]|uniref:Permease n=1 Tax=Roseivirga misakiensis TaxID=1563681 RepID=A0A1E5T3C6_9BACT|nr:DMT family transporter [Roseivirga misakiensis]OEK05841.1 permease [Roseivirga misakiensis]
MKNTRVLAWTILIILALVWGSSFILIKRGLAVYNAGEVGALRILAACIFLLPLSVPKLRKLSKRHIKLLFGIGLLGSFIPAFLFALGQTQLDSGVTGVMNGLTPIFVLIVGAVFFKQKFQKTMYLGIFLAFLGTAILLTAGSNAGLSSFNIYAVFIVLATMCYGLNLNFIKYYLADLNAVVITGVSILLVGPLAAAYLFFGTDFTTKLSTTPGAWDALGYISLLGVMSTSIALILFNRLVQITTPIFTSMVTYLIPIVAIAWGLLDGETLTSGQIGGMGAILLGVFITNRKKKAS